MYVEYKGGYILYVEQETIFTLLLGKELTFKSEQGQGYIQSLCINVLRLFTVA